MDKDFTDFLVVYENTELYKNKEPELIIRCFRNDKFTFQELFKTKEIYDNISIKYKENKDIIGEIALVFAICNVNSVVFIKYEDLSL